MKYTEPFTLTLDEGASEPKEFYVAAWNQSNNPDYANSDIMICTYVLYPVAPGNTVDEAGNFRYTLAKKFTLSKDEAVCWRIKSADVSDTIVYNLNTENADTIPAKEAVITVCAMAGITPAGTYTLPVQISTDGGRTWTDESAITFRTSELVTGTETRITESSGGGCNSLAGLWGLGAALLAVIMKSKKH